MLRIVLPLMMLEILLFFYFKERSCLQFFRSFVNVALSLSLALVTKLIISFESYFCISYSEAIMIAYYNPVLMPLWFLYLSLLALLNFFNPYFLPLIIQASQSTLYVQCHELKEGRAWYSSLLNVLWFYCLNSGIKISYELKIS